MTKFIAPLDKIDAQSLHKRLAACTELHLQHLIGRMRAHPRLESYTPLTSRQLLIISEIFVDLKKAVLRQLWHEIKEAKKNET